VRSAVLEATMAELAASSYEDLRIDDVAARAGVNKTTVYRRWPTKAELVAEAAVASSAQAVPIPDTGTLAGDLTELARSVAGQIGAEPGARMARNLIAAAGGSSPEIAKRMPEFWSQRLALTQSIIDRSVERGELDADADPNLIIEMLIGAFYVRLLLTARPITTEVADVVADVVHRGITGHRWQRST
jgi:AcrR family transcriptional regulator